MFKLPTVRSGNCQVILEICGFHSATLSPVRLKAKHNNKLTPAKRDVGLAFALPALGVARRMSIVFFISLWCGMRFGGFVSI